MLNGLLTPSSDLNTSLKSLVPLVTNGRMTNCIVSKRGLYKEGKHWTGYSEVTKNVSTDGVERKLLDVQGPCSSAEL